MHNRRTAPMTECGRAVAMGAPEIFDSLNDLEATITDYRRNSSTLDSIAGSLALKSLERRREEVTFMVGEYYADYSELTADELAASDANADALIARSRVVSTKRL